MVSRILKLLRVAELQLLRYSHAGHKIVARSPEVLLWILRRFMIGSSDSDSDDDKRVVRSAKDRRFDELKATCEEMRVSIVTEMFSTPGRQTYLSL